MSKEELEKLKGMTMQEKIAYGSSIGKDLKISKILGGAVRSGAEWIKNLGKGKKQDKTHS